MRTVLVFFLISGVHSLTQFGLAKVWGKSHLELPQGALDLSGAPVSIPDLEALFRRMPADHLYVRIPGQGPAGGAPQRIVMADIPDLAARVASGEPLHLQAINLHLFDEGFAAALKRFRAKVEEEIPEAGAPGTTVTIGLFLSSAGVVAPFHADHEHNFLAQIVGDKHMHLFSPADLQLFPCEARESLACDDIHVLQTYSPSIEARGAVKYLSAGSIVYHPPMGPHWVDTGKQGYSLSVSVSFVTPSVDRVMLLHKFNRRLRRFGVTPAPVGRSPSYDGFKYAVARSMRDLLRIGR